MALLTRRKFLTFLGVPVLAGAGFFSLRAPANPYYNGAISDHFDGTQFFIKDFTREKSRADLLKWRLQGERAKWPDAFPSPFTDAPPQRVQGGALRVSYVGHASFLIQASGINILIHPVWSDRASPVQWAGPKRVNPPGIAFADLPPIDAVLVSHNHYDHLDLATLRALAQAHPAARFLAPLGNDAIMRDDVPAQRMQTHDWGARVEIAPGTAVHFEPIYHWSARGLFDRRMALWCAFVIEAPAGKIYHVADTGFGPGDLFRQMREKHGGFRLAVLPIGAYAPRWFMGPQHMDPEEAVKAHLALGSRVSLAIHHGTIQLTDEAIDAPATELRAALRSYGVAPSDFLVPEAGEVVTIG